MSEYDYSTSHKLDGMHSSGDAIAGYFGDGIPWSTDSGLGSVDGSAGKGSGDAGDFWRSGLIWLDVASVSLSAQCASGLQGRGCESFLVKESDIDSLYIDEFGNGVVSGSGVDLWSLWELVLPKGCFSEREESVMDPTVAQLYGEMLNARSRKSLQRIQGMLELYLDSRRSTNA